MSVKLAQNMLCNQIKSSELYSKYFEGLYIFSYGCQVRNSLKILVGVISFAFKVFQWLNVLSGQLRRYFAI